MKEKGGGEGGLKERRAYATGRPYMRGGLNGAFTVLIVILLYSVVIFIIILL